jgi:hypothetical protein
MRDSAAAKAILASDRSISDKIRALAADGWSRSEIADLVSRSYQQVRQVLVEDERRAGRAAGPSPGAPAAAAPPPDGVAEESLPFGAALRLKLEPDGVLRLPSAVQAALGVRPGSVLVCELEGETVRILGPRAAWERLRSRLNLPLAAERDLVAELIAERRTEAAREDRDD